MKHDLARTSDAQSDRNLDWQQLLSELPTTQIFVKFLYILRV